MRQHFEFSKIIVKRTLWVFFIQMVATAVFSFVRWEVAAQLVSLMNAAVPVYIVILGGYFGKAGLENYNKIKYEALTNQDCLTPSNEEMVG